MARDSKVIQRGVNVQGNDFALPAGTPIRALNIDYARDGVAARRVGFEDFWDGLPIYAIDESLPEQPRDDLTQSQRGFYELFSRDRLMHMEQGMIWSRDKDASDWLSVPVNMPHRITMFGTVSPLSFNGFRQCTGIGKAISVTPVAAFGNDEPSAFRWQNDNGTYLSPASEGMYGTICNDTSQATAATATQLAKFIQPADVVSASGIFVSDNTTIRNLVGTVFAGSITSSGTTDGTGTAARFNGASWMTFDLSDNIYVADNTNQIRKITPAGVVTTFAGSTTAGDTDGTGTTARFRNISGMCFDGSDIYVTEGSSGNRVRKITTAGVVTIFAGTLTAGVTGTTDGVGTSARFNNPTGIEYGAIGGVGYLFVGDTGNNRIRKIAISSASVTTLTSTSTTLNTNYTDGIVPGPNASAVTPAAVLRGIHRSKTGSLVGNTASSFYLLIECTTTLTANTIDIGLVDPNDGGYTQHIARCPSTYANSTNGPMKLDTWGINTYSPTSVRGVDVGGGVAFTTSERPRVLDIWTRATSINTMPRLRSLGVEAPEAPSCTTIGSGATFANNTAWAYRTVCGLTLPDGRIALGPPSERVIVTNTSGGTVNGSVTAFPSAGLPYDGMPFVQLYRTKTVASSLDPGDQMFLAYETPLAYGAGIVITDIAPDVNLGPELYTNQTQPGAIAASSLPPPGFAREVASFNQRLVLGNYIERASVRIKVLGVTSMVSGTTAVTFTSSLGTTRGFPVSSSITLTATNTSTQPASKLFLIATGGTAAANAAQTARNIARCINRCPDAYLFTAYYDENDPGAIVVYSLFPGQTFDATVNPGTTLATRTQSSVTFSTNLSAAFNTVFSNVSTRQVNAVAYSDQNDFDSFPVVNTLKVGPSTESIQRLLPLSERLLAVKDDSVFAIDETFATQIYDAALSCSLPNSFAKINNQWIGLFTRGFCALNATQATAIGRPIDRDVTAQYRQLLSDTDDTDFANAAAIDTSGNYVCTFNTKTYVYNVISQSWSEWQINSVSPQEPVNEGAFYNFASSGMRFIGAFDDTFVTNQPTARGVWRQRDWRRNGTDWYHDYSDMAWQISGTIGSDLQTITVSDYTADSTSNPMSIPPFNRIPPTGSVVAPSAAECDSRFIVQVVQGSVTAYGQGTVEVASPGLSSSSITVTMTDALAGSITAGAASVTLYSPILCQVQYAPSVAPGQNSAFIETVVTTERSQPGYMQARFFGRKDLANANVYADGLYENDQGVRRAMLLASLNDDTDGDNGKLVYNEVIRFEVASDRAFDQQLGLELWEANAWQPLALKSVVIDYRPQDNSKVNQ